jgi:YD repeat-containing protein
VKVLGDSFMLDTIDHVGIQVLNVRKAITWYRKNFKCKVLYEDKTWGLLEFENTKLALVSPGDHPPHFAIIDDELVGGDTHRDGSRSSYVHDEQGNMVEKITYKDIDNES